MYAELAHHGALISLLSASFGLGWILRMHGHDHTLSLSLHAAKKRLSNVIFLVSLCLSAVAFYGFAVFWLTPHFVEEPTFVLLITTVLVLTVVTAFVPDSGGWKTAVHRKASWSMALLLPIILLILLVSNKLSMIVSTIVSVTLLYMIADLLLFVFVKWSHQYFLIFQSTYILSFYVAVLAIAYA